MRVRIEYNGMTSFVPPCFCWDLINEDGKKVDTVSSVRFERGPRVTPDAPPASNFYDGSIVSDEAGGGKTFIIKKPSQ